MPNFTEDEIKARIADGSIFAISVDTSIFDRFGCNLGYASLRALDQFQTRGLRVLLSEIIEKEVTAHIQRDAAETQRALKSALKDHKARWNLSEADAAAPPGLALATDPRQEAERQFNDYVAATHAEIVPASEPDSVPPEVLRRYFTLEPPFEGKAKKKNEFPDAFALLSLEARAEQEERLILCVSADGGWKDFAAASNHLVCMDDIERALSLFNEADQERANQVVAALRAGQAPTVQQAIETAIQARLDDSDFEVDAHAPVNFEAEPLGAALQTVAIEQADEPTVIAADDESITFTIVVPARVGFEAGFSYYVRDGFDRDYVGLGSEDEYVEEDVAFEVALTVSRVQEGEPEVLEAQVPKQRFEVDFGYVEPFKNEDPTHEKY